MATELGLSTSQFTRNYCNKEDGIYHLKDGEDGKCLFLEDNKCGVYQGRPTQCRTWPFWPEAMNAKVWDNEVATFCPGIGKGKLWNKNEIQEILDTQIASEEDL